MSKQIVKITEGYVKQVFDADTCELLSQEFVVNDGGDVGFEDENGRVNVDPNCEKVYSPFDMIQPNSYTPKVYQIESLKEDFQS